jgi:hypothetical protein
MLSSGPQSWLQGRVEKHVPAQAGPPAWQEVGSAGSTSVGHTLFAFGGALISHSAWGLS